MNLRDSDPGPFPAQKCYQRLFVKVVAVVIQYRLGVFGFLSGEKVKEGGALNAGLCKYLGSIKKGRL